MRKNYYLITLLFAALTALFCALYFVYFNGVFKTLAITFGVCLYHFAIRLIIGACVTVAVKRDINVSNKWFHVGTSEQKFYGKLGVKKWKNRLPTFNPSQYDLQNGCGELIKSTCRAEITHEICFAASYLPLICIVFFGSPWAFAVTSVCASAIEIPFIIAQRCNRPRIERLQKLIEKKNKDTINLTGEQK